MMIIDTPRPTARAQALARRLGQDAQPWEVLGLAALAAIAAWWTWRALHDPLTLDLGLAYQGGVTAWHTGHPERLATWISTPFLGLVMAVVSRIMSADAAAKAITVLNLLLVVGLVSAVLVSLRHRIGRGWWWLLALALASYGPMMSTVWWKQFNLIAVALAALGFLALRRGHDHRAAFLIALSISVKPLAILLPVALLVPRRNRRAGVESIVWIAILNLIGMVFYAWRAHAISALNPVPQFRNFQDKGRFANIWSCHPENFAPGSTLCRLVGGHNQTVQELLVYLFVAVLASWIFQAIRGRGPRSWETFAFTMPLSVMLSPIAWSHYQIMLAPLFVLLYVRFVRDGAGPAEWAGLVVAFVLASLVWQPYGTSIGAIRALISTHVQTQNDEFSIDAVAEFAQYALVITGVLWYATRRRVPTVAMAPGDAPAQQVAEPEPVR